MWLFDMEKKLISTSADNGYWNLVNLEKTCEMSPIKGIVKRAESCKCGIFLVSRILWHNRIIPALLQKNWDFDVLFSPATFHHDFSLQIYPAPFQWRLLFFIRKNEWHRVLEANKKQVLPKSYSLKIKIGSVNQILKNKEKVTKTCNINILTRITGQKILCVYTHA